MSISDTILNLYFFATDDVVTHVGYVIHDGTKFSTEQEQVEFLRNNFSSDLPMVKYGDIPKSLFDRKNGVSLERTNSMSRRNDLVLIFSDLTEQYNIPVDSLYLITPVVNGVIKFDITLDNSPLTREHIDNHFGYSFGDNQEDYVLKYFKDDKADFGQLLKDDHFSAIHLLFKNKHYLSAMKLLLSFIDTIAWIDIGEHHNFIKWIDNYSELDKIEITSEELWEFRNSLLHMTNLDSKKVMQGKVRRISFAIDSDGTYPTTTIGDTTFFSFVKFLYIIEDALKKWVDTYNDDRTKIYTFVQRYDRLARH